MTERQVQRQLNQYWCGIRKQKAAINNIFWFDPHEADQMIITRDNELIESEIKCSESDFLNDFKKTEKHEWMENQSDYTKIPNYFYYVSPEHIIPQNQIPHYAGLLYIIKLKGRIGYYVKEILKAPRLHGETIPCSKWQELALKLYNRNGKTHDY